MTEGNSAKLAPVTWRGRVLGLSFMCVLTVILSEFVLGLYDNPNRNDGYGTVHRRSETPGLTFEPIPGASTRLKTSDYNTEVRFNSYGMRGPEPTSPERHDVVRIAAVGDSFTFGMGVEAEEAWPELLQQELALDGRPVEVLNFGVCGYSIDDNLAVVEHKVPTWRPNVIILGYYFNDPDTLPLHPVQQHFLPVYSPYKLKLFQLGLMLRRYFERRMVGDEARTNAEMVHSDRLPYWHHTLEAFDRFSDKAREMDATLIAVIFPNSPPDWSHYALRPLHEKVAAALRERGVQTVDLLDQFSRHERLEVRISASDDHPTVFGHQIISETLAPVVEAALDRHALSMR